MPVLYVHQGRAFAAPPRQVPGGIAPVEGVGGIGAVGVVTARANVRAMLTSVLGVGAVGGVGAAGSARAVVGSAAGAGAAGDVQGRGIALASIQGVGGVGAVGAVGAKGGATASVPSVAGLGAVGSVAAVVQGGDVGQVEGVAGTGAAGVVSAGGAATAAITGAGGVGAAGAVGAFGGARAVIGGVAGTGAVGDVQGVVPASTLLNWKPGDPISTFARASSATFWDGTGVARTAAVNTARDNHHITGTGRTLLMEAQGTNLLHRSRDWASNTDGISFISSGAEDLVTVVTDATELAAVGLQDLATGNKVLRIDNRTNRVRSLEVRLSKAASVGATHSVGLYARGAGGFMIAPSFSFGFTQRFDFAAAGYLLYRVENVSFGSTTEPLSIFAQSTAITGNAEGDLVYVILPQVEEGANLSSITPSDGNATTRATDSGSLSTAYASQQHTVYERWVDPADGLTKDAVRVEASGANVPLVVGRAYTHVTTAAGARTLEEMRVLSGAVVSAQITGVSGTGAVGVVSAEGFAATDVGFKAGVAATLGTNNALNFVIPASVVAGDLLLACVSWRGTGAIATPSGWAIVGAQVNNGTALGSAVFRRIAQAGDAGSTVTFANPNASTVNGSGMLHAYLGVHQSAPINGSAQAAYASSTTLQAPAVAASAPRMRVVFAVVANGTSVAQITGWTEPVAETSPGGGNAGTKAAAAGDYLQSATANPPAVSQAGAYGTAAVNNGHQIALARP